MSTTIIQKLADFAVATSYETLPETAVHSLKASLLDTVGCMLYGCATKQGELLKKGAFRMRSPDGAGVVGETWKAAAPLACLVNGALAGSMAFDDLHHKATTHCGCVGVPAALACADVSPAPVSGKAFLAALAVSYEIMIRVALSIMPSVRLRGYHPASVVGGFGGAAAAAKIMGLDRTGIANALGIGGGLCSGLMSAQMTSMIHGMQAPNSAMQGVYAACWAREGMVGTETLFEEHYGSFPVAVAGSFNQEALLQGLGERFEAADVGIKHYPTAGSVSSALDAVSGIMKEKQLKAAEVAGITVSVNKSVFLHCGFDYTPGPAAGAQMSIRYCLAALLACGKVTAEQFERRWIFAPAIARRMAAITVVHDPAMDDLGPAMGYLARVIVRTTDSREFTGEVAAPKGSAANRMSEGEVRAKYMDQAAAAMDTSRAAELADVILGCEAVTDMRKIREFLYR